MHVRTRRIDTGVRVQRILERSRHHDARIVGEDIFGAIAVMHVEVDHRCAFNAVLRQRMSQADGNQWVLAIGAVFGLVWCAFSLRWALGTLNDQERSVIMSRFGLEDGRASTLRRFPAPRDRRRVAGRIATVPA